jgi:G3E family GTPase
VTLPIPTNLITGFLGSGKTTAILQLLKRKPADEKWAVLVNEFGEIGIDGAILQESGAAVREVPGGCICCVADLPMKIGLNMLIAKAQPDRLIIEPTGLGHPQNILDTLQGEHYRDQLELRASIALVDARKVDPRNPDSARYRDHETFRDQLRLADLVVASKSDLCDSTALTALRDFLAALDPPQPLHAAIRDGELDTAWLDLPHRPVTARGERHQHLAAKADTPAPLILLPGQPFARRENRGADHVSCGWLFASGSRFNFLKVMTLLSGLVADRVKGLFDTDGGAYLFNAESGVLSVNDAGAARDSRLEIIHREALDWDAIERALLDARL